MVGARLDPSFVLRGDACVCFKSVHVIKILKADHDFLNATWTFLILKHTGRLRNSKGFGAVSVVVSVPPPKDFYILDAHLPLGLLIMMVTSHRSLECPPISFSSRLHPCDLSLDSLWISFL